MKRVFLISVSLVLAIQILYASDDSLRNAKRAAINDIKSKWEKTSSKNDSAFVAANSSSEALINYYHAGTYPAGTETDFVKSKKGQVIGPYEDVNSFTLYKNVGKKKMSDSVQVSHILYAYSGAVAASTELYRTKDQAKKSADSLCALIGKGKVLLENVVEQVTDDPGSRSGNKGNYGWFTRESGFIQEYKDAAFANPVGATVVIESQFGYHIIQVEAKTKEWECVAAYSIKMIVDTCYLESGKPRIISPAIYPYLETIEEHVNSSRSFYDSLNVEQLDGALVFFSFNILEDGSVSDVVVLSNDVLYGRAAEDFAAMIMSMPKWLPAQTCEGPVVWNRYEMVMLR